MWRQKSFATVLIGKSVLIREGISRILRAEHFRISASASCVDELPLAKLEKHQLLFLIVHTGDDFEFALSQIRLLREKHPKGRVAMVADHYRLDELASAFRAGANGYFADVMTCEAFIKSVELVLMGETIFPKEFLSFALDFERAPGDKAVVLSEERDQAIILTMEDTIAPQLSPREKSILQCLVEGNSNKCIARKVGIAEATVKVHVKAILRKIRVQNRTQAAIWGMNNASPASPPNSGALPSPLDNGPPFANSNEVSPEIKHIGTSDPPEAINLQPNHVGVPRIDRLIRKNVSQRINGTPRLAR
jgi:two-component system nitrate/nitrite response regulator NarL